jgi:hypothetical protein
MTFIFAGLQAAEPGYINSLSHQSKQVLRKQLITKMVAGYREDRTFEKISAYMLQMSQEHHMAPPRKPADVLMGETFNKMQNLYDVIKPIVGNKTSDFYDSERFTKTIRKYLWLRGLCFFILGIGEEHKEALAFFYLPQNEALKQEFMGTMVRFIYPEVPQSPENEVWFREMAALVGQIGYDAFNVNKFVTD